MLLTSVGVAAQLLLSGPLAGSPEVVARERERPRLLASPEVRVSQDGEVRHVELTVAANPQRPANLLGASMLDSLSSGVATFASLDAGRSWSPHAFPGGAGDPQVTFTQKGTALFATLADREGEKGRSLLVYRSADGGMTWSRPTDLGRGYDHPQIVVDRTSTVHAGRIYLGVLWDYPVYRIGVFYSDDDGRSWRGPVESANGGGELGINVCAPSVLSDGTLFVPYVEFEFKIERRWAAGPGRFASVLSTDGGRTFSAPRPIVSVSYPERPPRRLQAIPMFAAAPAGGPFEDRIFAAWNVVGEEGLTILVAWSTDRGASWSEPRPLPRARGGEQSQPAIAVNGKGVLGITWYETDPQRAEPPCSARSPCFDEYFTASLDGGATFLGPVRLSSQSSYTRWRLSSEDRYGNGGDCMGLAADDTGTFHAFWADSRTGTYQVYAARVRVLDDEPKGGSA